MAAEGNTNAVSPLTDANYAGAETAVLVTLLQVARQRLVSGGKLVFWLPTRAETTEEEVKELIEGLARTAEVASEPFRCATSQDTNCSTTEPPSEKGLTYQREGLVLKRVRCEPLNGGLWRWLCVLENM
jgi:hypothetical protein